MTQDEGGRVEEPAAKSGTRFRSLSLRAFVGRHAGPRATPIWAAPLGLYLLTRLVLYVAALYGGHATLVGGTSALLTGWDAGHYLDIVAHGYPAASSFSVYSPIAFFPGFPVVARLVMDALSITALEAAMAVALVEGGLFVVAAAKLAASAADDLSGKRAGLLVAAFPGTLVVFLPYAEAQAALLVALALLGVRRGQPYRAGVFGALATFTSPLALALTPALAAAAWRRRDAALGVAAGISALGFVAYMAYLGQRTGDLFAWFREEWTGFDHHLSLASPFEHLRHWPGVGAIELASLALAVLGVYALRRMGAPIEWTVYSALVVVAAVFDSAMWATPRILLDAFPLVLAIGVWLKRDAFRFALAGCAMTLPVLFLLYTTLGRVTGRP